MEYIKSSGLGRTSDDSVGDTMSTCGGPKLVFQFIVNQIHIRPRGFENGVRAYIPGDFCDNVLIVLQLKQILSNSLFEPIEPPEDEREGGY